MKTYTQKIKNTRVVRRVNSYFIIAVFIVAAVVFGLAVSVIFYGHFEIVLTVDGGEFYAIKLAQFETSEGAQVFAESVKLRGAGGYVHESDGAYKVYAAVYDDIDSAQSVLDGLLDEFDQAEIVALLAKKSMSVKNRVAVQTATEYLCFLGSALPRSIVDLALCYDKKYESDAFAQAKVSLITDYLLKGATEASAVGLLAISAQLGELYEAYDDATKQGAPLAVLTKYLALQTVFLLF